MLGAVAKFALSAEVREPGALERLVDFTRRLLLPAANESNPGAVEGVVIHPALQRRRRIARPAAARPRSSAAAGSGTGRGSIQRLSKRLASS